MRKNVLLLSLLSFLQLGSCTNDPNQLYNDTPTAGTVKISSDETLSPVVDAEKDTFMALYVSANLKIAHKSEADCFNDLLMDSAKVILATRKLNDSEEAFFKKKNLIPVTTKVAYDAIALVINKQNTDSTLTVSQFKNILTGNILLWNQLDALAKNDSIAVVFDNNGSSTMRFLSDSILNRETLSQNCFAVNSNKEVIDYVEKNRNAIGIIGISWISDRDDPSAMSFLSRITVVGLTQSEKAQSPDDFYKPYQAYIATKEYPLIREVYMINREGRTGLGTGFVSFVAADQGQRLIRLSGLLPATMPIRLIKTD